ncbi:MAG: hypothetical protein JNK04_26580 [Myxococcales bacterium]|nr:hypothetical protein [Myxococcales bacterium]
MVGAQPSRTCRRACTLALVASCSAELTLWSRKGNELKSVPLRFPKGSPGQITRNDFEQATISNDGTSLALLLDGRPAVWDVRSGDFLRQFSAKAAIIGWAKQNSLVVQKPLSPVEVWSVGDNRSYAVTRKAPGEASVSPDGSRIVTSASNKLEFWSTDPPEPTPNRSWQELVADAKALVPRPLSDEERARYGL